jgi:hypothetical protein
VSGSRPDVGPKVVALIVFAVALWAQTDALAGVFYDDGIYLVGAKALATGTGYRNIHLPEPFPIVHYPFLYSAMLSLLWRVWPAFPQNLALFALFDAAALAGAAWVISAHARRIALPSWLSYGVTILGFTAVPMLTIIGMRLSEALFLLLAAGAVAVADRDEVTTRDAGLAGALAGLATLTRSIGIAIIAGVALGLLLRSGPRRALIAGAAAVVFAMPWTLWVVVHGGPADPALEGNYGTYLSEARQAGLGAMLEGLDFRAFGAFASLSLPVLPRPAWLSAAALLAAGVVWGAAARFRSATVLIATLAIYTLIVSLWPFPPHRFMWIVVPWYALLLVAGCARAWSWSRTGRAAVLLVVGLLTWGFGWRQTVSIHGRRFGSTAQGISRSFRILNASIRDELPHDVVVASEDEALIYLYTGRNTVPSYVFQWSGRGTEPFSADTALAFYCRSGVSHVALTAPALQSVPPVAGLQARQDSTLIPLFEVTRGPSLLTFRCPG